MVYRVTAHGEPDLAGDIGLAGGQVGYMMGYSGVQSELLDVISGYNYGNNHHTLEYMMYIIYIYIIYIIYIYIIYSLELKLSHSFTEPHPQGNFQEHPSGCLFFRLVA